VQRATGPRRVTIDLDGAWCYRAVHGAPSARATNGDDDEEDALLLEGTSRFLDMVSALNITATLFVVGRDLKRPLFRALIRDASAAGHDVMSHSYSHAYDLARWPQERIRRDLAAAQAGIADVTGIVPTGFRAPGYTTSEALWGAMIDVGLQWSSSVLPSPAYLAARRLVRLRAALRGTQSSSQAGTWASFSPAHPRPPKPLVEHPITTAAGLPWIGTTIALSPDAAAAALTKTALLTARWMTPFTSMPIVFEAHAADFADGRHLPPEQPDAHVRLDDKLRRLRACLTAIRAMG
jgi:peptidoglycan/xylan/chitin deacetylase (PgdA/CDA1 family)